MSWLVESPLFGVLITLLTFEIGLWINKKTKLALLNPLLLSMGMIIALLYKFDIPISDYNRGGQLITFFIGPSTVALAIPLYKHRALLKSDGLPILGGVFVGTITSITTVILMVKGFGLDTQLGLSLVPKSITTPIGIEVSKQIGGLPQITIAAITITGVVGAIVAENFLNILKIKDPVAKGVAIGTSAHALGTSKAIEMGDVEGSMSGLSIGIAGLLTVFLAPLLIGVLHLV